MRYVRTSLLVAFMASAVAGGETAMQPYPMDWRDNSAPLVDLSSFLDAPAGGKGPISIRDGHLVAPDGKRFRIWGVNVTGSACFPSREDAPVVAAHLARFGINGVRFHFLDSNWSASLFVRDRDDTQALDPDQLDKLDFFVAELKKRGIYTNLNLNVGRNYRKGDGVKDHEYLGLAKVVNYFDEQVQMLHKEYARQLLTHRNPYTGTEYRYEPAVAIVELVNENSIVEAWFSDRLLGRNIRRNPGTWTDITAWYAGKLTRLYNKWLGETLRPEELAELRKMAGVGDGEPIPRLTKSQFKGAPAKRFHTEASFYMHLEREYFSGMYEYLKNDLGVKSLIVGTSDHNHYNSGYPLLTSTSACDVIDGHVYWQHPRYINDPQTGRRGFTIPNTPMVNNPANSTVVQLARSAMAGKPYTVSETNHPFPNEYACEGIGILGAYAAFHDWDGIFFYTFEHKVPTEWTPQVPRHFEIRPDPVKMTNIAAGACLFLRGDVQPAEETIQRSYSPEEIRESIRNSDRPFFTQGYDPTLALKHGTRIRGFETSGGPYPEADTGSVIASDTGELAWYRTRGKQGLMTVNTDRSQALIGYVKTAREPLKNFAAEVENEFCSITLTSLDDKPISQTTWLLLVATASAANTGMKWDEDRTSLIDWGTEPTVIEPVSGSITLRNIDSALQVEVVPLDSTAKLVGKPIVAMKTSDGYRISLNKPTPWYFICITRHPGDSNRGGLSGLSDTERIWVKCAKCGRNYQMGLRQFYLEIEEKASAHPEQMTAHPLTCRICGQDAVQKAYKCNQCGVVFLAGSVRGDYEDRCPKCRYSRTEAVRKARLRAPARDSTEQPRSPLRMARTQLGQLMLALNTFEIDVGRLPTTSEGLRALVEKPASGVEGWQGPYLRRLPPDPWGNEYRYRGPGRGGEKRCDLFSAGPDGTEGTADDIAN